MTSARAQDPNYRQLRLWRDATRLLVTVETAAQISSVPQYTLNAELHRQAMGICRGLACAAQCTDWIERTEP